MSRLSETETSRRRNWSTSPGRRRRALRCASAPWPARSSSGPRTHGHRKTPRADIGPGRFSTMVTVNSPVQRAPRSVVRRWRVLCVLGLLVGLLGMHGLAPGGAVPEGAHGQEAHSHQSHAAQAHSQGMSYGHCGGGSVQHADATCASGALSGGPVLPQLVPDPVPAGVREGVVRVSAVAEADGARAPPSLAELQLLRI
ncbi:DUF6153 family protein [Streptomyces sp. NPDC050546]|uniref:DUF6153 family protein n=1 Tax=Streptomyces sp. NPDC050546 TaxID=3365628 RepID=UPI003787BB28